MKTNRQFTAMVLRAAALAIPLFLAPIGGWAGPLDFSNLQQVGGGPCNSSSASSCLDISSMSTAGGVIDIVVDFAHIISSDLSATATFTFSSGHGSVEGDTVHGCNGLPNIADCPQTNFFLGQYWGGPSGVGDNEVVSNSTGPEFHHGGPLYLDTDMAGFSLTYPSSNSLTISYNLNPGDGFTIGHGTYDYSLPFDFIFNDVAPGDAPEPATFLLLGSAMAVFGFQTARKRQR